jgi:hypothetical protein
LDGKTHQINVTFESSGISLFNSPMSLSCHAYAGNLDGATIDTISGWALDWYQIETPITVDIYDGGNLVVAGVPAANHRGDLATGGDYQSQNHGFSYPTPPVFLDGNVHTVVVAYGGSTSQLPNSGSLKLGGGPPSGCASPLSTQPRWPQRSLAYASTTGVAGPGSAAAVATAINNWNGVQNNLVLTYSTTAGPDVLIQDNNNLPNNEYGVENGYDGRYSPCANLRVQPCGFCSDQNVLYYADVELNANLIKSTAQLMGGNLTTMAAVVIAHELGHVAGLANLDANPSVTSCAGIQTIMYSSPVDLLDCNISPTRVCDGPTVLGIYGSGPACTAPLGSLVCTVGSAFCQ